MKKLFFLVIIVSFNLPAYTPDANAAEQVSKTQFDRWMTDISNLGRRWRKDDELGTLNLITPEKRIAAAKLVTQGISVSLALNLNKKQDELNTFPFEHTLEVGSFGGHEVAGDRYSVQYLGFVFTHGWPAAFCPQRKIVQWIFSR